MGAKVHVIESNVKRFEMMNYYEDFGNGLTVTAHWNIIADGRRNAKRVLRVDAKYQGITGSVVLNSDLDWPDSGIEWEGEVMPWESFESDIQDWIYKEVK